jgi:hypothetical protein
MVEQARTTQAVTNGNGKDHKNTQPKLSRKNRLKIVRDILLTRPDYKKYGFNRQAIKLIQEKFNYKVTDAEMSKLIRIVEEQWETESSIRIGKTKVLEMYTDIFEKSEDPWVKLKTLQEIGKISGLYIEKLQIDQSLTGDKLNDMAEKIIKERIDAIRKK